MISVCNNCIDWTPDFLPYGLCENPKSLFYLKSTRCDSNCPMYTDAFIKSEKIETVDDIIFGPITRGNVR